MSESLEKRLAQVFVRGYALVLLVSFLTSLPALLQFRFAPPEGVLSLSFFNVAGVVLLVPIASVLWVYSNSIAGFLAGSDGSAEDEEGFEIPLELGVRLVGLVFLVRGFSGLAGEVIDWYVSGSGSLLEGGGFGRPQVSELVRLWFEAAFGLILFLGLDSIVKRLRSLRGMPAETNEDED